jgi:Matrixin
MTLSMPRSAAAYALEGPSWAGQPTIPIHVQLGSPASGTLLDGFPSFDASVLQAIKLWNHYLNPGPPLIAPTVTVTGPGDHNDGITQMFFASTTYNGAFGPNVLAVTFTDSVGSTMTQTDIIFNSNVKWDSYRGELHFQASMFIYDIQRVAIHELGHALGLAHPDQAGQMHPAIMNSIISGTDVMQDDDIQGENFLYHGGNDAPGTLGTLTNISTRLNVLTGTSVAIPGFIVQGTGMKQVIIRAIGPSLAALGVPGVLQAPSLQLHNATTQLSQNTGWMNNNSADIAAIQAANLAPNFDTECVIVANLPPGSYTAPVTGVAGTTGVALVEVYDIDPTNTAAKLTNVSTRGQIQTGANVMIGGFIVNGTLPKRLGIRAIGPSLSTFGVQGTISDPTLSIFDATNTRIYFNDNWADSEPISVSTSSNPALQPSNAKESTIIISLPPGAYTAIVQGAGGVIGNGRVDVFETPQ